MPETSEVPALPILAGCISKADIRAIFFQSSKHLFLQSVQLLCDYNQDFAEKYDRYKLKKNLPKELAVRFLEHNQFFLRQDYVLTPRMR